MLPYPLDSSVWTDLAYFEKYGEEKAMREMLDYEEAELPVGKDWGDAVKEYDPIDESISKFHKDVVIPWLEQKKK